MKNVQPAFGAYKGNKLGESFRRKARLVGGGHTTTAPSSIKFLSVVSRDSARIDLTITS